MNEKEEEILKFQDYPKMAPAEWFSELWRNLEDDTVQQHFINIKVNTYDSKVLFNAKYNGILHFYLARL
jgi:hypothetical protein